MVNNKGGQAPHNNCDKTNSILSRFGLGVTVNHKSMIGGSSRELVKNRNRSCASGQVMLMTVVMLSGAILASTSLAGLLILYQLRQATDAAASTKAIFAADAGLERALYNESKLGGTDAYPLTPPYNNKTNNKTLDNGATYTVTKDATDPSLIKSIGRYGRAARAFQGVLPPSPTP